MTSTRTIPRTIPRLLTGLLTAAVVVSLVTRSWDSVIVMTFVGAGAVIPPGKTVHTGELWLGNPARPARRAC